MKEIFTAVTIICASSLVCSILSNFITDGSTKKIMILIFGAFIICILVQPIKTTINSFEFKLNEYPAYDTIVATDDEAYSKSVINQTKINLETILAEILLQNNVTIKSSEIVLAQSDNCSIIISSISIYINKDDINKSDLISELVEKNFGIIPGIITE